MTIEEWAKDFKSFVNELQMPRDDYKGIMSYIDDALAILKEQEAVEPHKGTHPEESAFDCGACGYPLWEDENYCSHCGKPILWEGR